MAEKIEKILGNGFTEINTETKDGDKTYPVKYLISTTAADFKSWVATLSGDALDYAWQKFNYGHDLASRQKAKPGGAAETTIVKLGDKDVDLMTLPLPKALAIINGVLTILAAGGKVRGEAAFQYTAKVMVEQKKATMRDGVLVPVGK